MYSDEQKEFVTLNDVATEGVISGPVTPAEIDMYIKEATRHLDVHWDVLRAETVTTRLLNAVLARGLLEPSAAGPAQRVKDFLEGEALRLLFSKLEPQLATYARIADVFSTTSDVTTGGSVGSIAEKSKSTGELAPKKRRSSLSRVLSKKGRSDSALTKKQSGKSVDGESGRRFSRLRKRSGSNVSTNTGVAAPRLPSPVDDIQFNIPAWKMVFESNEPGKEGRVFICCASSVEYALRFDVMIPHPLHRAMVPFQESDLWPLWMPAIKKPATLLDEAFALHKKLSVEPNILGLLKFEVIGDVTRFLNTDNGFLAEEFHTYPTEKAKTIAQTRNTLMKTLNYRAWFPTTAVVNGKEKDATLYSDITFNRVPVPVPERILSMGIKWFGPKVFGAYRDAADLVLKDDRFKQRWKEDRVGLYGRLREVVATGRKNIRRLNGGTTWH